MPETVLGLVVPLFDEADRIGDFGPDLAAFATGLPPGSRVLFVDDGSTDATLERLDALLVAHPDAPLQVLQRPHLGKGAAVAAGLAALDTPVRAFCDVDLSTPLEDLTRIVALGARPNVLAIGSRDLTGSTLVRPEGRIREALGRSYNRLLQATITPGIVDTQCGAKAATGAVSGARPGPHPRGRLRVGRRGGGGGHRRRRGRGRGPRHLAPRRALQGEGGPRWPGHGAGHAAHLAGGSAGRRESAGA